MLWFGIQLLIEEGCQQPARIWQHRSLYGSAIAAIIVAVIEARFAITTPYILSSDQMVLIGLDICIAITGALAGWKRQQEYNRSN